jgi:hypothetical protein
MEHGEDMGRGEEVVRELLSLGWISGDPIHTDSFCRFYPNEYIKDLANQFDTE